MIICPHCGYERKKEDEIINATECPKCGIIYSKWKPDSDDGRQKGQDEQIAQTPNKNAGGGKKHIERWLIYASVLIVLIVVMHTLIAPSVIKIFQSPENPLVEVKDEEVRMDNSRSAGHNDYQSSAGESVYPSENAVRQKELSIAEIIKINRDSVVVVKTSSVIGSGFFINREGHIVTNRHVLYNASRAEIKTSDGKVFQIRQILQEDSDADLVIASTDAPPREARAVSMSSDLPEAGEKIVVIGNPLGLEQTVSDGIVSAVRRNNREVDLIQVTAPVSSGNSGGPLLNMRGEVIGVATFQYRTGQNLNFCVAASRIIAMQRGVPTSAVHASEEERPSSQRREVYCYADASGQVFFVDWRTDMQVSRPDGTLDRVNYEKWVLEQIGGNPSAINPEKEALDDMERNREELFKSVFPHRSISDADLTDGEKEWLERRYRRHYVEVYNQWMSRRNDAVRKYNSMMNEFDRFNASRR